MRERTPWTPGPWRVARSVPGVLAGSRVRVADVLAGMAGRYPSFEERDANARLIAHAPELFDALMQAWAVLDHLAPNHPATELASELLDRVADSATHQEEEVSDAS